MKHVYPAILLAFLLFAADSLSCFDWIIEDRFGADSFKPFLLLRPSDFATAFPGFISPNPGPEKALEESWI